MFSNLQIRTAKPHRRKSSMATRSGVAKRRVSQTNGNVNDIPSMSFMEDLFGDEFPEAFAGSSSNATKGNKSIKDLPVELLAIIAQDLSKLDLKRLRLASKHLASNVDLRIDRLYVSPNRTNLECLRKILEHPRHRFRVVEIVWDDAQLDGYPDFESFRHAIAQDEYDRRKEIEGMLAPAQGDIERNGMESGPFEDEDIFDDDGRLTEVTKGELLRRGDQASRDMIARYSVTMSVEDSYEIYQRLYEEEQEIMKHKVDAASLQHALAQCPNLERVTLTSEAWRPWNFEPAYSTPFHRSLPPGFKKPSVWPWHGLRPHATPLTDREHPTSKLIPNAHDSLPPAYRGYTILLSALISMSTPTKITELIIYPCNEPIGIGHQLFATPNADLTNTLILARTIPLTRLQLSLNSNQAYLDRHFTSGLLRATLEGMTCLQHLDFAPNCWPRRGDAANIRESQFQMLRTFPAELLRRLKTFALRNAAVSYDHLFDSICAMSSAQHVTLDNVNMHSGHIDATYFKLVQRLWIHYNSSNGTRPAFTVIEPIGSEYKCRLVSEELGHYLHRSEYDGIVPFEDQMQEYIRDDCGWVVDDRDLGFVRRVGESWVIGGDGPW